MHSTAANGTLMRVVGMSRSGNHAIIDWIVSGLSGRWCFLNCVEPKRDPWQSARPMDDGSRWRASEPCACAGAVAATTARDHLVLSHEDTFLTPVFGEAGTAIQEAAVGGALRKIDVLILRDPYNLFASRWRGGMGWVADHIAQRIWKQHAKAFLRGRSAPRRPLIGISYNDWVSDDAYRGQVAESLKLAARDDPGNRVARCGGGSSFDGYELPPERLRVFDRWQHYADDPSFRRLFDEDIHRLSAEIFGFAVPFSSQEGERQASPAIGGAATAEDSYT